MNVRKSLKTKLIFIGCLVMLTIVATGLFRSWKTNSVIDQEISGLQNNIKGLEKDNLELKELVEYFNSAAYVEEKARIDLGLKKAEEKVVIVSSQRERGINPEQTLPTTAEIKNLSNPQKWWRYFFN